MLVYTFVFAPKPWEWALEWLKNEGTLGGAYDESSVNTDEVPPDPGADDGPELDGNYDLAKLPWPPATSTAPPRSIERFNADFSDCLQTWCCDMVLGLVNIKKAFPDNVDTGRLASQISNPSNKSFTQN